MSLELLLLKQNKIKPYILNTNRKIVFIQISIFFYKLTDKSFNQIFTILVYTI